MTDTTTARLAAIKARAAAATEGPWAFSGGSTEDPWEGFIVHHASLPWWQFGLRGGTFKRHDAEFLANARQDVPWLVEEVARLRSWLTYAAKNMTYPGVQLMLEQALSGEAPTLEAALGRAEGKP